MTGDRCCIIIGRVEPIIVGQFLSGDDGPPGNDPDIIPLEFYEAVGVATVVDVNREVPVHSSINAVSILQVEQVSDLEFTVELFPTITLLG